MSDPTPAIPTTEPKGPTPPLPAKVRRVNLAEDAELVKEVLPYLNSYYLAHQTKRSGYEEIWELADEMFKAGQNETLRESERVRKDRQGDTRTKTKAKKTGSTLFYRTTRTLAALYSDILHSQRDPYTFLPRANEDVQLSADDADELAQQHNMLMRYSRDQEGFSHKAIDFLTALTKYGNVPIYSSWKREKREVLDRWPVLNADGSVQLDDDGRPKTTVKRKVAWIDNRPETNFIPPNLFYADPDIGDVQKQNALYVVSDANISAIRNNSEYVNVTELDSSKLKKFQETDKLSQSRQINEGMDQSTNGINTGLFRQMECHALLPIDESKPAGKRWDAELHEPKRYWVTLFGNTVTEAVCVRIERNPDPDDEYPFEMVSLIPDDTDKLYHVSLAQLLRADYTEAVIARQQAIDSKTLQNNRPLIAVRGEVHVKNGEDLVFDKDAVFWTDNKDSISQFPLSTPIDNQVVLASLEQDANDAAGTGPTVRGIPMGSRTSSTEASNATDAASLPHKMMAKYIFEQWLRFHARKGVRQWHIYADPKQILKITDEERVYREIRPTDLFGSFDVQIALVDEYDRDLLSQQNAAFVAQQLIPLFGDVIDKRAAAKELFEKYAKLDASKFILPDDTSEQKLQAKRENQLFASGEYVAPSLDENHTVHLLEHRSLRMTLNGFEGDEQYAGLIDLLGRHIAQTEQLEKTVPQSPQVPNEGQLEAPSGNETAGEVAGNQIAGQLGAIAGAQ